MRSSPLLVGKTLVPTIGDELYEVVKLCEIALFTQSLLKVVSDDTCTTKQNDCFSLANDKDWVR